MKTHAFWWKKIGLGFTSLTSTILLFLSTANADLGPADEVLVKAGSIRALLKDPLLLKEYYAKLSDHFGGPRKFSMSSYNAIMEQLQEMIIRQPELEARLWETTNLGNSFSLTSAIEDFGLTLNKKEFGKYWEGVLADLDAKAGPLAGFMGEELGAELDRRWGEIRAATQEKLKAMELDVGLKKFERDLKKSAIYKEMTARPELEEAAAALLDNYYAREDVRAIVEGGDPNLILDFYRDLRDQPGRVLAAAGLSSDRIPGIAGKLKTLVPDFAELSKNPTLFKERVKKVRSGEKVAVGKTASGVYEFKPVPRRIHGIFKGVVLGECVGGSCNNLSMLTPERWATVALTDSRVYQIERGSSYLGFLQVVPIRNNSTGEIVGSVDFGSNVFDGALYLENKETKLTSRQKVFQAWLENAYATKPANWRGFVVGESTNINNAGALDMVHGSTEYQAGELLGSSKQYSHLDEFATNLIAASKKVGGRNTNYGGRMIFDGMTPDAGKLHELRPMDPAFHEKNFRAEFGDADFKLAATWDRFLESKNYRYAIGFALDRAGISVLEIPGLFLKLYKLGYDAKLQHLDPDWAQGLSNKFSATLFSKDAPDETKRVARRFLAGRLFPVNYDKKLWPDRSENFARDVEGHLTANVAGDWFRAVKIADESVDATVSAYFANLPASFRGENRKVLIDRIYRLDSVEPINSESFLKLMNWAFIADKRTNPGISIYLFSTVFGSRTDGSSRFATLVKKYQSTYGDEFADDLYEIIAPSYFADFASADLLSRRLNTPEKARALRYQVETMLRIAPASDRAKIFAAAYKIVETHPVVAHLFPSLEDLIERYPPRTIRSTTALKNAAIRMDKVLAKFIKTREHGTHIGALYYTREAIRKAKPALKRQIKYLEKIQCKPLLKRA